LTALPSIDQRNKIANRALDLSGSHATGELVNELLSDGAINMRQVVVDAAPLSGRKVFWKTKITRTTTTVTVGCHLRAGCGLR